MAYFTKYRITYATQTSKTVYLYLKEDLPSAPAIIDLIGINISLDYIPTGDEIYEAIYASQLTVSIDVTDNLANFPDFISGNDRKYFCELYLNLDREWSGFVLSDNVQISYSTGRKELTFNCIDGLGMLKDIPLYTTNVGNPTNQLRSVLNYMQTALNALSFPTTPNLVTVCSYFANGMTDRTSGNQYEPFSQALLPIRTFKNNDYTYESCYEVLEKLVKSFGCRLFQAGGKWWIVAVNEFANENNYFTEYNYLGTVVSSGSNLNTLSLIQGYGGNTSGLYFVDNSQFKLILKGFNRIDFTQILDYDKNLIDNGNVKVYTPSPLTFQSYTVFPTSDGSFSYTDNPDKSYVTFNLVKGPTGGYVTVVMQNLPKVSGGAIFNYSMFFEVVNNAIDFFGNLTISVTTTGGTVYYLGQDVDFNPIWVTTSAEYLIKIFDLPQSGKAFNVTTPPVPDGGQLYVQFTNRQGGNPRVSNFSIKAEYEIEKIEYFGYINNTQQYKKEIEIPFGYGFTVGFPTSVGALLKSDSTIWTNWYRYGRIQTYGSLNQLLTQQYINSYAKNVINVDCSISSFVTTKAGYPYVNASKMIKAYDTDPAQINISTKSYMLGNCTIGYDTDTIDATLLEISNTDIPATINYINYYK